MSDTKYPLVQRILSSPKTKQYINSIVFLVAIAYGFYWLFSQTDYPWQWYRIWEFFAIYDDGKWWAGDFVYGMEQTIYIVFSSIILSTCIGAMIAWGHFAKGKLAYACAKAYVTCIRNTPVLVQVYLIYFILAPLVSLDRFATGVLVLSIYEGAFVAEIIRGAIQSVSRGQWDAGYALNLKSSSIVRKIIFPQALRLLIGPMTNVAINLLKHSSIVSVIALQELTTVGRDIISETFLALEVWIAVALLYWLLSAAFAGIGRLIEKQIKWSS